MSQSHYRILLSPFLRKMPVFTYGFYFLSTEGLEGLSEHHFTTNMPPRNGNCKVTPTEGKVLKTHFRIECSGWHDEDGPLIYKVLRGEKLLQHGQDPKLSPSLLPLGPHQNNYTYHLTVKVFDKYNSFGQVTLLVMVSVVF